MKILIAADTYAPQINGAARFTERLAEGLARRGHDVHVAAPSPDGRPARQRVRGVTVHHVRSYRYPRYERFRLGGPWRTAAQPLVDELRPEVVHIQAHFTVCRAFAAAAVHRGIPVVGTNHLMIDNVFDHLPVPGFARGWVTRTVWRDIGRVFGQASVVTTPTPSAVELLTEATGLQALAVSCGIDNHSFAAASRRWAPAKEAADWVPTVLFVGRLDPEKRVDELLRAFAQLPADVPARLEVVGHGSCGAQLRAMAERLGVTDRITFHGVVTDEELVEAYGRADVFCMPGVAELQSIVTLEAMAAGRPVVAADAMALPHLVRPGRNGYLYTPGDVAELSGHLHRLLADPALRARMGRASETIVAGHTLDATLARFEDIYCQVTRGRIVRLRRAA
ncbi:glycosyltransferase [Desertihabitans aurantiacus]|uniref:glycosyltransferase n=1 Tax=Desertihabitans aurantiacus TaxID=2282477 RepID=UPI0018E50037|nr:glycosyltransferase [Desertihabitans aurantiacus]